jgi:hypothetical protein
MCYALFRVIPLLLNFICRRFGTLCLFHLHKQAGSRTDLSMKMEQTVFRNVGIQHSEQGESLKSGKQTDTSASPRNETEHQDTDSGRHRTGVSNSVL